MQTERFLRIMAWERAKGELRSMLHTYISHGSEKNCSPGAFEEMDDAVKNFIRHVEDNGLCE